MLFNYTQRGGSMFQVGSMVEWVSTGRGTSKHKIGKVLAVIPKRQRPDLLPYMRTHDFSCNVARSREDVSYFIEAMNGKRLTLYWPKTSLLKAYDPGKAGTPGTPVTKNDADVPRNSSDVQILPG